MECRSPSRGRRISARPHTLQCHSVPSSTDFGPGGTMVDLFTPVTGIFAVSLPEEQRFATALHENFPDVEAAGCFLTFTIFCQSLASHRNTNGTRAKFQPTKSSKHYSYLCEHIAKLFDMQVANIIRNTKLCHNSRSPIRFGISRCKNIRH